MDNWIWRPSTQPSVSSSSVSLHCLTDSAVMRQDFKIRPLTLNDFLVGEQLGGRVPEAEQLD